MNSILQVKLNFANERNTQQPGGKDLPAKAEVSSEKIEELIISLRSVLRFYRNTPKLLNDILIDVHYNDIIAKCDNVSIDIDEEGLVTIYHYNQDAIDRAKKMIEDITRKANVGEIYDGKAVRVENNYAFIELFPGTNGFLHVKDVAWERTEKVSDVIKVGDIVKVKVTQITDKGVNVSRKALLPRPVKKHHDHKEENKSEA